MEAEGDRSAFISRIGTFFLILGLGLVLLFVASDISRLDPARQQSATETYRVQIPGITQTYLVQGVQALQTRDTGAIAAKQAGKPTPTLVPLPTPVAPRDDNALSYLPFFCLGSLALILGWYLKMRTALPQAASSQRFEGLRKMREKSREAKAKKEAAKKEKAAKKK